MADEILYELGRGAAETRNELDEANSRRRREYLVAKLILFEVVLLTSRFVYFDDPRLVEIKFFYAKCPPVPLRSKVGSPALSSIPGIAFTSRFSFFRASLGIIPTRTLSPSSALIPSPTLRTSTNFNWLKKTSTQPNHGLDCLEGGCSG